MRAFVVFVALAVTPSTALQAVSSSRRVDASSNKNFPVSKVINLLKKMQTQLQKDADDDVEIEKNMACWCKTNDIEKTEAIGAAQKAIETLKTKQQELGQLTVSLTKRIDQLNKDISTAQTALDEAIVIRKKEFDAFDAEQRELIESVKALEGAKEVLAKHQVLLQQPHAKLLAMSSAIQSAMLRHADMFARDFSKEQRDVTQTFLQALVAGPAFKEKYQAQSGEVYGIISQMLDTFKHNLSEAQKGEQAKLNEFEMVKAAKEAEINAAQEQRRKDHTQLTEGDLAVVQARADLESTQDTLSADEKFLADLKNTCSESDTEFAQRQKDRALELEAVVKAIAILDSDESHALFSRSFNQSFLQIDSSSSDFQRRQRASKLLSDAALKAHSPRLEALAIEVQLDAFTKVKAAIDQMVVQLQKQQADEVQKKDWCNSGINSNTAQGDTTHRALVETNQTLDRLHEENITTAEKIVLLASQTAEMKANLKVAGENREKEHAEFKVSMHDQQETLKVLDMALSVLSQVYKKGSLVQQTLTGPSPPKGFDEYKQNEVSKSVKALLQEIMSDAQRVEAEMHDAETRAQKAYETFVKDTNDDVEENARITIRLTEQKADIEKRIAMRNEEQTAHATDLSQLKAESVAFHQSCDFLLKNFDIRQQARGEELEALKDATRALSGAGLGQ